MEFKKEQLDNGLTIIGEINPLVRSMALGFFVRTGSRDETAEISGVSHFLEHMLFKGTKKRSALEVNLEFDRMGAKYNAFTSEENTVFYAAVLPEYQRQILELWADLMRPALRDEDFNLEKGVILQEIAMYKDMPNFDVLDRCRAVYFDGHSCGNSVLGTEESIQALKSEQMREYFGRRYAADNIVLACAGNIKWEELVEQVGELCGGWLSSNARRDISGYRGKGQIKNVHNDKVVREHICMMSAAPAGQDERRYAAGVLANIIGDDTGSRLYWGLVDSAWADCANMEYDPMDGTGAYYTYISCDPDKADKVVEMARGCMEDVRKNGITAEQLNASKNKIASGMTLHSELPMGRLVGLGFNWVYRKTYMDINEELGRLKAVDVDEIMGLLEDYPLADWTVLKLGPQ